MTYLQAAVTILTHAERPLTIGELTATAVAYGLVRPRGYTPDRSMSSVLYRRMAADPDAPITAVDGRFWLRGRPFPAQSAAALRPGVRHIRRGSAESRGAHGRRAHEAGRTQRATTLPKPLPITLPLDVVPRTALTAPGGRRERAIARLADRLQRFVSGHALESAQPALWEAERTFRTLVAPLLTLLGYRRADQQPIASTRGRLSRLLSAGAEQPILLDVLRADHTILDADARSTLARAIAVGARWALLANGRELRLYALALSGAGHDPAGALVLAIDLHDEPAQSATLLWLLARAPVGDGALDAYLAARAVGAVLLSTLDNPNSTLVAALTAAVEDATGLRLPATVVARHARLAVRGARGRDGEPMPEDIVSVAAIGASTAPAVVAPERARVAS